MKPLSTHVRGESTFVEYGVDRLSRVCHAVGLSDVAQDAATTFRRLLEPWGDRPFGAAPVWASDIVDDHTPFEISVTVGGRRSEVRVLVEAQGDAPTLRSQRDAGRALSKRLEKEYGACLKRLHLVEDLFLPEDPKGLFSVWHAVSFRCDGALDLKVYLNLQARGRALAPALAEEALARLGFDRAWSALSQVAAKRGFDDDELLYFSLDLSAGPESRAKIYLRHHGATARDLESVIALSQPRAPQKVAEAARALVNADGPFSAPFSARSHAPGEVAGMCRALGGGDGPFSARAPVSCFSYVGGDVERPTGATIYFPITGYVTDDREAKALIGAHLNALGVSAAVYERAIDAFTPRPLEEGVGMQSYVSFRHEGGAPRLTVYFGPEAYSTQPRRTSPFTPRPAPPIPSPEQIVRRHEVEPVTDHPFFRRMRREPVDLGRLWSLMANFRVALIDGFPRMLSSVVARVRDDRIRCLLAKQLDDELGHGDFTRAHKGLFAKLMQALDPWRPADDDDALLAPGHALRRELELLYFDADAYEGVGASLLVEVYGKQVDQFLGDEFRRQSSIERSSLEWLTLHEDLEVDHADDSLALTALVPEGASTVAAVHGALAIAAASRVYFDSMYQVCFG